MTHSFLPILIMLAIALALGVVMLALNWVIGRQQRNPSNLSPYESGVPLLDENRKRVNVRFYQIAMLFILFDIEAAFLYPWAVIYRGMISWYLFEEMLLFILLLGVGYVYVWKKKAFDWKSDRMADLHPDNPYAPDRFAEPAKLAATTSPDDAMKRFEYILARYPTKEAALLPTLHL